MEQWKPVAGYEKYYEVSNEGRVRSIPRTVVKNNGVAQQRKQRIKSATPDRDGYLKVGLCADGVSHKAAVHRLVAEAFVSGWFEGAEVDHIDADRTNNKANNLRWVSHQDNVSYAIESGRHVSQRGLYDGAGNPNYGNRTLHERYQMDHALAIEKQSRPGEQNGRATPVAMETQSGEILEFGYFCECADYLIRNNLVRSKDRGSVASYIAKAAKTGRKYYGLAFYLM